jgi:hypothetical protein
MNIPLVFNPLNGDGEQAALTQDVSARGVFFCSEVSVAEGSAIELTFVMPSEITLTDSMRVRCRGRIVRVVPPDSVRKSFGYAVLLEQYDYLPEKIGDNTSPDYTRVASLHERPSEEKMPSLSQGSARATS